MADGNNQDPSPPQPSTEGETYVSGPAVAGPSSTRRPNQMPINSAINGSSSSLSSTSSNNNQVQQIGSRQGTRSRSRTTRKTPVVAAAAVAHHQQQQEPGPSNPQRPRVPPMPRYNSEDHPLSAHKLAARGYHSFNCLGVPFHVPKRYTFLRELGIGAYGCVALARDEEADMNVAIKKVTRVFERDVLARRALREVAILRHLIRNQNCTALIDFDATFIDFSEIYLVLSASEADLSQIIRSGQTLSDAHLQYFAAQLLRGVRYMHGANIIHRDLKPGNLLVNADCALFICDFGLARAFAGPLETPAAQIDEPHQDDSTPHFEPSSSKSDRDSTLLADSSDSTAATDPSPAIPESPESPLNGRRRADSGEPMAQSTEPKTPPAIPSDDSTRRPSRIRTARLDFPGGPVTEYVSTRWYRAPEIMLGFKDGYGPEIDMWSVGCILAELASGRPLFDGKDYVDQIARIHKVLGAPEQSVLDSISSDRAKVYVDSLPKSSHTDLSKVVKGASPGLLDMLQKLLIWDPKERLSAEEALKHPWLSAYHGIIDQWDKPAPFAKFDEVELINTLPEFKAALQKESREVKGEYQALFGSSQSDEEDPGESQTGEESSGSADDADEDDNGDEEDDVEEDGRSREPNASPLTTMDQSTSASQKPTADATLQQAMPTSSSQSSFVDGPRRNSETSCSSDSASHSHHSTTDTGAALSSPITSNAESSAAVSSASSAAGDLTLRATGRFTSREKGLTTRRSLPGRPKPATTFPQDASEEGAMDAHLSPTSPSESQGGGGPNVSTARYRRRAISNAQRMVQGEDGSIHSHGHQMSLDLDQVPMKGGGVAASDSLMGRRGSSQGDGGLAAVGQMEDLSTVCEIVSPPSPQNKIAPSPDFKSFSTDLIARPRSEVGAFTSPSLDAGDAFSQCVAAAVGTTSNPSSRRGSRSAGGVAGGDDGEGSRPRRQSRAEEMNGLISAIRVEAEKLRLSRVHAEKRSPSAESGASAGDAAVVG